MFYSFDGIDGVGKSTQIALFVQWLRESGQDVVECRDPGSTPLGNAIRNLLLDHDSARVDMHAEMLLYMAARAQMVSELIAPALQAGKTVVCDRYLLATIAYQGHAGNLPVDEIRSVGCTATQGICPDVTFLLDNDPDAIAGRFDSHDRVESRGIEYQKKVRAGFLKEAVADSERIRVIDASKSIDEIQQQIRGVTQNLISNQATGTNA